MLHLFQRQSETLDRRARRLGAPRQVDAASEAGADNGDAAAPDGQEVLERVLAELRERVAARERAEAAERTEGKARPEGRGSGIRRGPDP